MIAIIDYGMGNLRSVQKGFEKVGHKAVITRDPQKAAQAKGVVLPGVGAFADAMANLKESGLAQTVLNAAAEGKPFLGICLGQQLLFEAGEEWGLTEGLGIFPGRVRRFPGGNLKVPHMGWNQVEIQKPNPLLEGIPNQSAFYFVHSYYVDPRDPEVTVGITEYGVRFSSFVGRDNIFGIQFHPEKSSILGLKILDNFGRLVKSC
ncbi:imidazole glycerol phosphate synthase subunit HisH [Desulfolucanica intricata]|uniref:imidazole glycerol phosphate synthase subunit HisH n=1 Tax=Desulfolucanica intricata TaxID=1285191 RepID=UPI000833F4C5|nr:imidazole glycerol phosphate synthase subunit HisH [Desulfolucanica intricata]